MSLPMPSKPWLARIVGLGLALALVGPAWAQNYKWTQRESQRGWTCVGVSGDGLTMISGIDTSATPHLFVSTDGGGIWSEKSAAGDQDWASAACSSDGQILVACGTYDRLAFGAGGKIVISKDQGATWTAQTAPGARNWYSVACSSNGQTILAAATDSLWLSTDGGDNWVQREATAGRNWHLAGVSPDGTLLVAGDHGTTGGHLYTSTDGVTWTQRTTAAQQRYWSKVALSSNGAKITAVDHQVNGFDNTSLWRSTDSGASWSEVSAAGSRGWFGIACDSTGNKLAAVDKTGVDGGGGRIWFSSNGGTTWVPSGAPAGIRPWTGVASASDGGTLFACESGGYLFTGAPFTNSPPTDSALSAINLPENNAAFATVGTLSATDANAGDTHTFSLVAGTGDTDNNRFAISGTALQLRGSANFEVKSSYQVRVDADDGNGGTFEKAFTISITNVNEIPTFTKGANQSIDTTTSAQTVTGWATAIDDGDSTVTQALTFNVTEVGSSGIFTTAPAIASNGTLTYTPNGTAGTATISVTLTDDNTINGNAALTTAAQTFTIQVKSNIGTPVYAWNVQSSNTTNYLYGVWGTVANNVWAVGSSGTILKWNGTTWTSTTVGTKTLRGVWGADANNVWAVGDKGTILKWNGTTWTSTTVGNNTFLNGVWGADASNVWAVGSNGTILKGNGSSSTWAAQTSGTENYLYAVWGADASNVWAVGYGGKILKWDGSTWTSQASATRNYFLWGTDANNVWAVGSNGTILKGNGTTWTTQPSGTSNLLYGVWGADASNVWAVGDKGTILKSNGATWTSQTSGTTESLWGVWGTDANNVWAVGSGGTILKWGDKPPTLAKLTTTAFTVPEDAPQQTVNLTSITDGGNKDQPLTVTATSSNTALIPNPTVTYTAGQTTATLHYQPVTDAFGGPVTITVTVAENFPGGQSVSQTFTVSITPQNNPPTLAMPSPNTATINEDADWQFFDVTGISPGPGGETGSVAVTVASSNESLIPNAPAYLKVEYPVTGSPGVARVSYKPMENQPLSGSAAATLTVTVTETTGTAPLLSASGSYAVTVNAVNDAPTLSIRDSISLTVSKFSRDLSIQFNATVGGDTNQTVQKVSITNNNPTLVPSAYTSQGYLPNSKSRSKVWTLHYAIAANQTGTATLRLRAEDNGPNGSGNVNFTEQDFTITVLPVNTPPSFDLAQPSIKVFAGSGTKTETNFATNFKANDAGQALLRYDVRADNPNLFTGEPAIANNGTLTFMPGTTAGTATVSVTAYDDGGTANNGRDSSTQDFTIEVATANTVPTFEFGDWRKVALPGSPYEANFKVACSMDGRKLFAASANGGMFVSSDSGLTWNQAFSLGEGGGWKSIACSATGHIVAAIASGATNDQLWISQTSGQTWINPTSISKLPQGVMIDVAVSRTNDLARTDGEKVFVTYSNAIYEARSSTLVFEQSGVPQTFQSCSAASSVDSSPTFVRVSVFPAHGNGQAIVVGRGLSADSYPIFNPTGDVQAAWISPYPHPSASLFVTGTNQGVFRADRPRSDGTPLFRGGKPLSASALTIFGKPEYDPVILGVTEGLIYEVNKLSVIDLRQVSDHEKLDSIACAMDGCVKVVGGASGIWLNNTQTTKIEVADSAGSQSMPDFVRNLRDPDAGQTLSFNVTNDNSALFTAQPSIAIFGTTGDLSFTPAAEQSGTAIVTVKLADGVGESTPKTFTITVGNPLKTSDFASNSNPITLSNGQGLVNDSGTAQTLTNPVSLSGSATIGGAQKITLNGTVTLTDDATLSVGAGGLELGASFTSNPAGKTLTKTGPGPLIINASSFNGTIIVKEGEVIVLGSNPNLTLISAAGGVVKGNAIVAGLTFKAGSTSAVGASPGQITAGTGTWEGGFSYEWEINRADGTAGIDPGWDHLNHTGTLTISATAENPIELNLRTLTAVNAAGSMVNFNPLSPYAWKIASATGGITGFDAAAFKLDTSGFTNATDGGAFGLALRNAGTEIVLTFTPKRLQRFAWTGDASSGISSTNGTLWARHFGVPTDATINGVTLAGIGWVATSPEFDLAGGSANSTGDTNTLTSLTSQGSATVAQSFSYGGNPFTMTFKQLTPGSTYMVTLLTVGWDSSPGQRWQTFSSGTDTWRYDHSAYGEDVGSRLEYTFTATSDTRVLTITPDVPGNTFHLYAVALRTDPNTPPSFTLPIVANQSLPSGSGMQAVPGFIHSFSAGGQIYDEDQTVTFEVTTDRPDLFSEQPSIDDDGQLTYTPMAGQTGVAQVTVVAVDSGPGGNRSTEQVFTITISPAPTPNWSWEGGPKGPVNSATYPTSPGGTGFPGNHARFATWSDGAGMLSIYTGANLWRCDLTLTDPVWTWLGGSKSTPGTSQPIYGTKGVAAATNRPGFRNDVATWRDASGNLWLFGGVRVEITGPTFYTGDLWKHDGTNWTWISGSNTTNAAGVYGTLGQPSTASQPGARSNATAWVDATGAFFLFGGYGYDASGKGGNLNDLWRYDPQTNQWTWLHGSSLVASPGNYGTKGMPTATTTPGARSGATATMGNDGQAYVFGGSAYNDLWRYSSATNTWCWVSGSKTANPKVIVGTMGVPSSVAEPAGRSNSAAWTARDGQIMIHGGSSVSLEDTWSYRPETNQWTWLKGPARATLRMIYGTLHQGSASTTNGGLTGMSFATDSAGNFWCSGGKGGSYSYAHLFKLTLNPTPFAETFPAEDVTYFGAVLQGGVNPNGTPTLASIRYGKQPDLSDAVSTPTQDIGSDAILTSVSEQLVTLDPGTRYYFQVVGTSATGTVRGAVRSFLTTGTAPAGRTVQFASASSSVSESAGAANVVLTLTPPNLTAPVTIPITVTSTATAITDFTAPAASVTFATGQAQALITVPIVDDKLVDAGESVTLGLGTLPGGITAGTPVSHVLTINDDDASPAITTPPQDQFIALGETLNLSVAASGGGTLSYQWKKNNVKIAGATSPTYTVHNASSAVAGLYKCDVTNLLGTATSTEVKVFILNAASSNVRLAPGKPNTFTVVAYGPTGTVFTYQWVKDRGVTVASAKDFKLTAAQVADTGSYSCIVRATGSAGPISREGGANTLTVTSAPALVYPVTSFIAIGDRNPDVGENLGIRLDLTTTGLGTYTAKLTTNGANAVSVVTKLYPTSSGTNVTTAIGETIFVRPGLPTLWMTLEVDFSTNSLRVDLENRSAGQTLTMNGFRNVWNKTPNPATSYVGQYNFALDIPSILVGNNTIPQGNGFGSFTVAPEGTYTCAGETADGLAFTSAGFVGPTGQVAIYAPCKAPGGSIFGTGQITPTPASTPAFANNSLTGTLSWNRAAAITGTTYRAGLAPMDLTIIGGKYKPASPGGVVRGLVNADNNAKLIFSDAGLTDADLDGTDLDLLADTFVFSIRNLGTALAQTIKLPAVTDKLKNYNQVSAVALPATPTGLFTGSFLIPNTDTTLVRKSAFRGLIVWDGTKYLAPGYFLLPQAPQPGETVTTSPVLSGQVVLEPAP